MAKVVHDNLKHRAASGMVWTALQKYSMMGIQFISGIILARLLTPFDYGCIGMLSIFMVLADAFVDGGFGSALIQKKNPTQKDYSTIFYWNLGMALLMYTVLFLCAPAISRFYNLPLLCDVLRVEGLVLFIHAFNIVQRNQLKKKLNFKVLSLVSITTALIALSTTIILAYFGFGVWALVVQNLILASIPAIFFWFFVKWRPVLVFSRESFKELFSFGFFAFLISLLTQFSLKFQGLLIGRFYTPSTMGFYSKAEGTERLASTSISKVMTEVTYPLYAEMQNDKNALSSMIRRLTMTLAYISFPMIFVLMLCAKPIFVLLYSDRWLQSVPYFQVLCFAGLAGCLQSINTQSVMAIGKSKTMFLWTLLKKIVCVGAIVLGLVWFGMKGLLAGVVFNAWFSYFVNICLVSRHIGYKWSQQIRDLLPMAVISLVAALICVGVSRVLQLNMYLEGVVKFFVFLSIYLSWSFILKPEAYTYFLSNIPKKFKFGSKNNK